MGFVAAAKLSRPIVLGASMSGEICLELALRHPEAFTAIIACEASENIERRHMAWGSHPAINAGYFVPEWIRGLMAPQSPAESWPRRPGITPMGPGVFFGDIAFYSGDWDARDRVGRIDTSRCPLFMLTGEYDYSCTAEIRRRRQRKSPACGFRHAGIGHFPFAENPALFADIFTQFYRRLSDGVADTGASANDRNCRAAATGVKKDFNHSRLSCWTRAGC